LKEVAEAQRISQHYLEQIASALRRAGFIKSVRGAKGGYRLARPPEEITALEVVEALEGSLAPVGCIEDPGSCCLRHRGALAPGGPGGARRPRPHHPPRPHRAAEVLLPKGEGLGL